MKIIHNAVRTTAVVLSALAVCTASVSAQEPNEGGKKGKPDLAAEFAKADADSDGKVTKEELKAVRPKATDAKLDKMFTAKDKDGDGSLNEEEFTTGVKKGGKKGGKKAADEGADESADESAE